MLKTIYKLAQQQPYAGLQEYKQQYEIAMQIIQSAEQKLLQKINSMPQVWKIYIDWENKYGNKYLGINSSWSGNLPPAITTSNDNTAKVFQQGNDIVISVPQEFYHILQWRSIIKFAKLFIQDIQKGGKLVGKKTINEILTKLKVFQ
jgi:hypothetical protein